jgi:hypothetical protein
MKGVVFAVVELSLEPSDRRFRLPSPTRSLLFEFVGEAGPVIFGAVAASAEVETFAPGVRCEASLSSGPTRPPQLSAKGPTFVVRYPRPVGHGVVRSVGRRS